MTQIMFSSILQFWLIPYEINLKCGGGCIYFLTVKLVACFNFHNSPTKKSKQPFKDSMYTLIAYTLCMQWDVPLHNSGRNKRYLSPTPRLTVGGKIYILPPSAKSLLVTHNVYRDTADMEFVTDAQILSV